MRVWIRGTFAASLLSLLAVPLVEAALSESSGASAPTSPPATVCGDSTLLSGPSSALSGAVTIAAGTNTSTLTGTLKTDTTYYLAAGTHTLGTGEYTAIAPQSGDTFIGAPGAVLSGEGKNNWAFAGKSQTVTIEYLTITQFVSTNTQYDVNHTGAAHWTLKYDTVETTVTGGSLNMGSYNVVQYNCLTHNAQYGFSGYNTTDNVTTITFSHNEVSYNDGSTAGGGKYDQPGSEFSCGCSGGGKFWRTKNVTFTFNYVHNNGNVGLWADTDNRGFDISDNYFSDNYSEGLTYEISYNAVIADNTFVGNGRANHDAAVFISESGGDSRVASNYSGELSITGNLFTDNFGGVHLYENPNRHCGTGTGICTLVTPSTYTTSSCTSHLKGSKPTQTPDYYDNCRWKTKTVTVTHNVFNFTPSALGATCTTANDCGSTGVYSDYGTTTPWTGWAVDDHISDSQNNHFLDNTYDGPWVFLAFSRTEATWTKWSQGFTVDGYRFDAQDADSTYDGKATGHVATTPPKTTPPATQGTSSSGTTPQTKTAPSAPNDLHSTAKTDDSVVLAWTAPSSSGSTAVIHYLVYKGGVLVATLGTGRTDTVTGLSASTAYQFTVKAESGAGTSGASNMLTVDTTTPSTHVWCQIGANARSHSCGKIEVRPKL